MRKGIALYDCETVEDGELRFHKGDVIVDIRILEEEEGWAEGRIEYTNEIGLIPINYIDMIVENEPIMERKLSSDQGIEKRYDGDENRKLPRGATPIFPGGKMPFPTKSTSIINNKEIERSSLDSRSKTSEHLIALSSSERPNSSSKSSTLSLQETAPTLSKRNLDLSNETALPKQNAPPLPARTSPKTITTPSTRPITPESNTASSNFLGLTATNNQRAGSIINGGLPPSLPPRRTINPQSENSVNSGAANLLTIPEKSSGQGFPSTVVSREPPPIPPRSLHPRTKNPFFDNDENGWSIPSDKITQYTTMFVTYDLDRDGYLSGKEVRDVFTKSGMDKNTLGAIWALCDIDDDGRLDKEEFILGMYLIDERLRGRPLMTVLPSNLIPPSKR